MKHATNETLVSIPPETTVLYIEQSPELEVIKLPFLPNLMELHISRSGKSVHSFSQVPNLRTLTIVNTPFIAIDHSIGDLQSLTKLVISLNYLLAFLPEELGGLKNLEHLEISYNSIIDFPMSLSKLSNLKALRLSGNELHRVPDFVHGIGSLVELDMDENHIRNVPDTFRNLGNLERLNLDNNPRLEYIPPFLKKITTYDEPSYEQILEKLKRQKQKAVYLKQRTMRLLTRAQTKSSPDSSSHILVKDPIMLQTVDMNTWLNESPKDHFILEYRDQMFALKKSYFKTVVPYFVLEACDHSAREYISMEKYGIPIAAILPLASVRHLASSAFAHFRLTVSTREVKTRPKLLIKNTVLHDVEDLHAEHISVLPERLIPYVRSYSHRWDMYINHFLRSGLSIDKYASEYPKFYVDFAASAKEGKKQLLEFIEALDEAFEKYAEVSDTDITVYRGTKDTSDTIPYLGIMHGFTSTSTNPIVAENFSSLEHNCCVYKIVVSAGVPFISVKKYSQNKTEDELLLPRGVFAELVDTIQPINETYIKEYVVRIRLVNETQFLQHRYVCKKYPVARISAVHPNKRTTQKLK